MGKPPCCGCGGASVYICVSRCKHVDGALLTMAAVDNLKIGQVDVSTAFLNGPLDKGIYMKVPEGHDFGSEVLRRKKTLYGLKKAVRAWKPKAGESSTRARIQGVSGRSFVVQAGERKQARMPADLCG
jgi:hypothetical protein